MADKEKMIQWFQDRRGKVTYSMTNRMGPNSYDCSSSVFFGLIAGGFLKQGTMGNTETLFSYEGTLLTEISRSEVQRGDIFISGTKGTSSGSGGHTGVFLSNTEFIHCSYINNGIAVNSDDSYMGTRLTHNFYRLKDTSTGGSGTNNGTQFTKLATDGQWGNATTRRLQEIYNSAIKDGVISNQYKQACNQYIYSAEFNTTLIGSNVIKTIQSRLKVKGLYTGSIDGLCGAGTIKAMQKALGTTVDGVISNQSNMVKAMQVKLNNNSAPF